ncbi:MAG: DUF4115 domain-containing protein [Alphaproteobacteria bacterium]|nr:DUF4115 domain-containing protein [Alphaproteobacteria bacterium]
MNEQQEITLPTTEMTAGEMLRQARTTGRRKREIATISKLLCIREEFLTALEEGNYRVIPEDVYILGFARSYAVELGLNPDEVILQLKKELGLIKDTKETKEEEAETKIVSQKQQIKIDKEVLLNWVKTAWAYVKKHWIWFASIFAALVLVIVLLVVLIGGGKATDTPENLPETAEVVASAEEIKEPDFRFPVHEKFEVKNSKEARVVLQAEKESWVKIEDARGSSVFSRVLVPGDVYYLPNGDKFKATFGNVGAIDVWVDGQLIKKLGPANTKKTGISMAPDALKSVGFAE